MSNLKRFVVLCLLLNVTLIKSIKNRSKFELEKDSSISNTDETEDFQCQFRNSCPRFSLRFYTLNENAQNTMLLHLKELDLNNSQLIKALQINAFKFIRLLNGSIAINCINQVLIQSFTVTGSENNFSNDTLKIFAQTFEVFSHIFVKPLNPYLFLSCFFSLCNLTSEYNSSSWMQNHCFRKTPR